jgi:DNA (cytosine-5)-methyltransferase 1
VARFESIHLFSGGGGDLQAVEMIGGQGVLAANHWTCAIENSGANYPNIEHLIGDLAIANPLALDPAIRQATVLCASPECDGWSLSRNHQEEVSRLGPFDPKQGIGRSRATVYCPMRFATALPNLTTIIMEQVVDMVRQPKDFARYVKEWDALGWRVQAVCANSAIWGAAPQSRDRLYLLLTRKSLPAPDVEFTPLCRCVHCDSDVYGIQTWKAKALKRATPAGPVGKYGPRTGQYFYRCPRCSSTARKVLAAPYIIPAAAAILWHIRGQRIGDRAEPLAPATMRRIETGLSRHHAEHLATLSRLNDPSRDQPVPVWMPYPTQTGRQEHALIAPPPDGMQVTLRNHVDAAPVSEPWRTVCGSGNHLGLLRASLPDGILVQAAGHTFERPGYARAWSAGQPCPVISGTLDKAIVRPPEEGEPPIPGEAFAVANFGTERGGHVRDATEQPMGTLTGGGQYGISQQSVLRVPREAVIASYYSASHVTVDAGSDPFRTQTAVDRHALIEPPGAALVRAGGTRQADYVPAHRSPAPTRMPAENYAALRPTGELPYRVEDAEFRMIVPEECARVMGIHQRLIPNGDGSYKVLEYTLTGTKRDRVRLAGNSLTPGVEAELLDRAASRRGCKCPKQQLPPTRGSLSCCPAKRRKSSRARVAAPIAVKR